MSLERDLTVFPWVNPHVEGAIRPSLAPRPCQALGERVCEALDCTPRRRAADCEPELHPGAEPCEPTDPETCGDYVEGTDA